MPNQDNTGPLGQGPMNGGRGRCRGGRGQGFGACRSGFAAAGQPQQSAPESARIQALEREVAELRRRLESEQG